MPKRLQHDAKMSSKRNKSSDSDQSSDEKKISSSSSKAITTVKSKFASFLSLDASLKDETLQVFKNDRYVCIRDKYPKSRFHLLLVPLPGGTKLLRVQDLLGLPDARNVLGEMKRLAAEIVDTKAAAQQLKSHIRYGFHAIQSMSPLHMHIISDDFDSDCLKNKKHWNSFTTSYFIHLDKLIENFENASDLFNLNKPNVLKGYLESNLKCHVCKTEMNNIPNLKKHILSHVK